MRYQGLLVCTLLIVSQAGIAAIAAARESAPQTLAFLGVYLQNDNEALEPTTAAEQQRMGDIAAAFKSRLEGSGRYDVLLPPPQLARRIATGQSPGSCNGCEIAYAKEIGGNLVAWIMVQKVSNLILNLNLYVGEVETNKMTFVHSVDIRGNTDESWHRSLAYLLDNYFFPASEPAAATQ